MSTMTTMSDFYVPDEAYGAWHPVVRKATASDITDAMVESAMAAFYGPAYEDEYAHGLMRGALVAVFA